MEEGGHILGHIQRFDQLSINLLNLDVALEEEDKSLLLLCSLSGSFNPLMITLLYEKEILVYEEIVSVLRTNEQRERMVRSSMRVFLDPMMVNERHKRGKERREAVGRQNSPKGHKRYSAIGAGS